MKSQESRFGKRFYGRSPELKYRGCLVDWMCLVSEEKRLKRGTVHLAVKLLDFFMDGHTVEVGKIYMVAIACLTLAAKFEEKDSRVPNLSAFMKNVPTALKIQYPHQEPEHTHLEVMVLKYFDWNIFLPTVNAFVDNLLPAATCDLKSHDPSLNLNTAKSIFMDHIKYFLDACLQVFLFF